MKRGVASRRVVVPHFPFLPPTTVAACVFQLSFQSVLTAARYISTKGETATTTEQTALVLPNFEAGGSKHSSWIKYADFKGSSSLGCSKYAVRPDDLITLQCNVTKILLDAVAGILPALYHFPILATTFLRSRIALIPSFVSADALFFWKTIMYLQRTPLWRFLGDNAFNIFSSSNLWRELGSQKKNFESHGWLWRRRRRRRMKKKIFFKWLAASIPLSLSKRLHDLPCTNYTPCLLGVFCTCERILSRQQQQQLWERTMCVWCVLMLCLRRKRKKEGESFKSRCHHLCVLLDFFFLRQLDPGSCCLCAVFFCGSPFETLILFHVIFNWTIPNKQYMIICHYIYRYGTRFTQLVCQLSQICSNKLGFLTLNTSSILVLVQDRNRV